MEMLINDILKQGVRKNRLELKLFGGSNVLALAHNNVGESNVSFIRQFVKTEGLRVVAEDLGGNQPRHIRYFPRTGTVMVRRLRSLQSRAIASQEKEYECARVQ